MTLISDLTPRLISTFSLFWWCVCLSLKTVKGVAPFFSPVPEPGAWWCTRFLWWGYYWLSSVTLSSTTFVKYFFSFNSKSPSCISFWTGIGKCIGKCKPFLFSNLLWKIGFSDFHVPSLNLLMASKLIGWAITERRLLSVELWLIFLGSRLSSADLVSDLKLAIVSVVSIFKQILSCYLWTRYQGFARAEGIFDSRQSVSIIHSVFSSLIEESWWLVLDVDELVICICWLKERVPFQSWVIVSSEASHYAKNNNTSLFTQYTSTKYWTINSADSWKRWYRFSDSAFGCNPFACFL